MQNDRNPYHEMLAPDDCALVVIDLQGKLLALMDDSQRVLENTVKLLRFADIVGLPVLVTEQQNLGPTVDEARSVMTGFEAITKIEFDACKRPEFVDALAKLGRNSVIIAGIESHICVTQTVLHLLPDYKVHVVSDAVASRIPQHKEVAIERMRQAGAVVSSTEMVMYEILERAGTDEFRQALKLVK